MNLNLFKITVWEDNEAVGKMGIVMGDTLGDAAKNLEDYFGDIGEIFYLSPVGDSMAYELDTFGYEYFSDIKRNFIW